MPLDFPNSPSINTVYSSGSRSWIWDGVSWGLVASGLQGPTGPTGPAGPTGPTGPTGATGDWSTAQTINTQTGTSYVVLSSDVGKLITLTNSSAITLTVNTGLGLSPGQRIDLFQNGDGQVTVGGSAVLRYTPTLKFRAKYSAATLICIGTDTFALVGDLAAS
jgi:hypothetical protein